MSNIEQRLAERERFINNWQEVYEKVQKILFKVTEDVTLISWHDEDLADMSETFEQFLVAAQKLAEAVDDYLVVVTFDSELL